MEGYLDDSSHNHIFWSTKGSPIDIKAPVVTLLSPDDNYITDATSVRQEWMSEDTDVDEYEYRSCTNNPNDEDCDLIYKTTTTKTYRYVNNNNIIFWWQVRATDKAGNTGEWSDERKITIDPDLDGVVGSDDLCNGADYEFPTDGLGTNRWIYTSDGWVTREPKGKGPKDSYTIEQTYGCSCDQILTVLEEKTGENFEGHHKFGCSKSILEAWIAGEYYVGPTYVETVEILAKQSTPKMSENLLKSGTKYFLIASGTANAGDGIAFDARYSLRTPTSTQWTDTVSTYESHEATLLDLLFNGDTPWGEYNDSHIYKSEVTGDGDYAKFLINDIYYSNNSGSLSVEVIEDRWVYLW